MDPNQFPSHQQDDITPDYIADDVGISQEQMDMIQEHHDTIRRNEDSSQREALSPLVIAPPQDLGHRPHAWKEPVAAPLKEHLSTKQERLGARSKEAVRLLGEFAMFHVETAAKTKDAVVGSAKKLKRPKKTDNEVLPEAETEFEPALAGEQLDLPIVPPVDIADQPTQEQDNVYPLRPQPAYEQVSLEDLQNKELAPIVKSILHMQSKVGAYAQAVDAGERHVLSYNDILTEESDRFVSALASPEGQRNIEDIPLTQAGIDLIIHGLGRFGPPSIKELTGVKKVFDAQQIELDQDTNTYISRFGIEFGPYEDEADKIEKAEEKVQPSTWFLSPEERAFYQEIKDLDNIVTEPAPYKPLPPRHKPIKNAIQSHKEKRRAKKYSPPVISDEARHKIELSEKILAAWQKRDVGDHSSTIVLSAQNQETILREMKDQAQKKIDRDDELRRLN